MLLEQYKNFHHTTIQKNFSLLYYCVGMGGESGEVLNEVKKLYRDHNNILTMKIKNNIIKELGDVLWYITSIAKYIDSSLEEIIKENMKKLSRKISNKEKDYKIKL